PVDPTTGAYVVQVAPSTVLGTHDGWVEAAAFLDAATVVTGSDDGTVLMWDTRARGQVRLLGAHHGEVVGVAVTPDRRHLLTALTDGTVSLWTSPAGPQSSVGTGSRLISMGSTPPGAEGSSHSPRA